MTVVQLERNKAFALFVTYTSESSGLILELVEAFEQMLLSILVGLTTTLLIPVVIGVNLVTFLAGALAGCVIAVMVYRLPHWH